MGNLEIMIAGKRVFPRAITALKANYSVNPVVVTRNSEGEALSRDLSSALRACFSSSNLQVCRQLHAQYVVSGISHAHDDSSFGAKILGMYVVCDSYIDAKKLFCRIKLCYSMPWTWMIRGFVNMGLFDFALLFYFKMLGCGVLPDKYTFPAVVKACCGLNAVGLSNLVIDTIMDMGLHVDAFVASSLVKLYADNGLTDDAQALFDKISQKDCVLWNVMLDCYVKCGKLHDALRVFNEMRSGETKPNSLTFTSVLAACGSETMNGFLVQLHGLVVVYGFELNSRVANTMLKMYSRCGHCLDARKLFNKINRDDAVTWNAMISGYVQNGFWEEASVLLREMLSFNVKPDSVTFSSFLPSIAESMKLKQGKEMHGYIVRNGIILDVFLRCALMDIYFKCREVEAARTIFNQSDSVDTGMCTAMISGYVLHGMNNDAIQVFKWLIEAKIEVNALTWTSMLSACAGLAALKLGKELHGNILKRGFDTSCHVGSAIMDLYAKCGRLDLAHQVFNRIAERDSICWNTMITNCSQNGKPMDAIKYFRHMGVSGMKYDCVSLSATLSACSTLYSLHHGKEIHGIIIKLAFQSNLFTESALIDMYAKCGNLKLAHRVFDAMTLKNEVSWNTIISAYGSHGYLKETLSLFHKMLQNGIVPDHVNFLAIISACSHAGQIEDGIHYFHCMTDEYGIPARMEHYACVVDLYGRAGRLTEALETIKNMPFLPDAGIWGALLGACRVHGDVELAELASRYLIELDPKNSGYYILLSNILADSGRWRRVAAIRNQMKERGVQKVPGYSWIEVNNSTHMFVSADISHSHSAQVYAMLNILVLEIRRKGYVPKLDARFTSQKLPTT